MHRMLEGLITSFTGRSGAKPANRLEPPANRLEPPANRLEPPANRLEPVELEELLESVPEIARKLHARKQMQPAQPRSVCSSLKDLCEL